MTPKGDRQPIPITKPYFGPEEAAAVQRPLESGWVVQGPEVRAFEDKFAAFTGAQHAVATSSCTTALHLAMAALGLRPGQEVVVPAFTWVATANVVEYMGATPRFCDVDLATFNADVRSIESAVTAETVGVIPVHLFGLMAEMAPIMALCHERGIWAVEDAACAFGAWENGRHAGTFGDLGCFSFHPRKSITTGEGGMVTTASPEVDQTLRSLRDHGASRSDLARHESRAAYLLPRYDHVGYNYRMTDLQGAIGGVQMDRAEWILSQRRRCAAQYAELLGGREWLTLPATPTGMTHGYQAFVCLFTPRQPTLESVDELHARRNRLMDFLEERGIASRQGTHAAALQGFYAGRYGLRPEQFPSAYLADRLSIALPLYPQMTEDELTYVAESLDAGFAATWHP